MMISRSYNGHDGGSVEIVCGNYDEVGSTVVEGGILVVSNG